MKPHDPNGVLRVLAWAQAVIIAVLAVMLLRSPEAAPAPTSPVLAAAQPRPAPSQPEAPSVLPVVEAPPPSHGDTAATAAPSSSASGTTLYGRVVDEQGEAIADGIVWLRREGSQQELATIHMRQGHSEFAIAGLQPGKIEFQSRATGYREQRGSIEIPAAVPRLRRDIVLSESWLLTVKILTPEGKPLHAELREASKTKPMLRHVEVAAVVTATQPEGDFPPTPSRDVTFGLGRWRGATGIAAMDNGPRQPNDVAGVIEIDTRQPLWLSAVLRHRVLASMAVEPGQKEAVLTIALDQVLKDLGSIRGRVVDAATGAAMPEAAVGFGDLQSSGGGDKVDAEGRFAIQDLRPGLLDVEIRAGKKAARRDLITLHPGQVLDLGDVPVFEYRSIKGRCDGIVGKAENGRISYTPLDPVWHPAVQRHTDSTSLQADGSFTLYLPDGRYRLRASGAGGAITEIDTRTLGDQPLLLQLQPEASLRLDVQTHGEIWQLAMFDSTGREVFRRELRDGWKFPVPLLLGDYRAELTGPGGKHQTRRLHLGGDGVDLRVP